MRELWTGVRSQQPQLRDRKLWVVPHPQLGPHPQFPQLRTGVKERTPRLRERRSHRMGISHAESYSRTPGSRAIWGEGIQTKPRPRLYHGIQLHWVWENQKGHCEVSRDANKSTWARPNFIQICSITLVWSFHSPGPQPLSRQDICFLICERPPTYCLCALAHDGLSGLGESVSKLEILPASPGNWCAT